VVFDEEKIKEFMAEVWREMINNYGMIEKLQGKLAKTPKKKQNVISTNKNSLDRSLVKKKIKKRQFSRKKSKSKSKKSRSKGKLRNKKKNRLIKTDKLQKPPIKKGTKEYYSIRDNRMDSEIDLTGLKKKSKVRLKKKRSSTMDNPKKSKQTSIKKPKKKKQKTISKI